MLASARGTKGGMKVFWTEGSGRVRGKQEDQANVGCLLPHDDGQLQQNCRPDPAIHALSLPRALSLLALSFFRIPPPPLRTTSVPVYGV